MILTLQNNYNPLFYEKIAKVEKKHFWFTHRVKIIQLLLKKFLRSKTFKMLEIGAGTCFVSGKISEQYNESQFCCLDLNIHGLVVGKKQFRIDCAVADITKAPFKICFDVIGLFDVLEHLEDDEGFLVNVSKLLNKKGLMVITVPAYEKLWSEFDVISGHKRRYSKKELINKIVKINFEPIFITYFNFILFPVMYLTRKKKSGNSHSPLEEVERQLNPPTIFNLIMKFSNFLERVLLNCGIVIPKGTSLIVVARKNG